jgi:adenylate cyclase
MGDGLLAEFASAVNAVECAIALQHGLAQRNSGVPEGQRIDCRIGVNLGDLIVDDDSGAAMDMHGDGVNIASRLQALAKPGDVLLSGAVYDQLKKKIGAGFEFLGQQKVKNIAEPVRLYRVLQDSAHSGRTISAKFKSHSWPWASAAVAAVLALIAGALAWTQPWHDRIEPASVEKMALPLPDKPSIAVLPFANMSDDPKQEYFADGMTDDLITELSKLSGLFVISRNSTSSTRSSSTPSAAVTPGPTASTAR